MTKSKKEFNEFKIKPGETLDGKDLIRFKLDLIKGKSDPVWAVQNILGFGDLFPWQEEYLRLFYRNIYDASLMPIRDAYLSAGQRSGKTMWAAMIGSYDFFNVVTIPEPQKFFGVKNSQKLFATCMSTSGKLAEDGIYAHMLNAIEASEWMNQWFDIRSVTSPIPQISVDDKQVYAQVLGSWMNTAVGRTNFCVLLDEIDYFEESTSKRSGMEVYSRMTKSRDTLREWGHLVAISSPKSISGPILSLVRVAQKRIEEFGINGTDTIGFNKPVWELNPDPFFSFPELCKRYAHDMIAMWRDFGCKPEMAGGMQFPEGIFMDETLTNILKEKVRPKFQYPHVMYIDPAARSDKFGISVGCRVPFKGMVVDGTTYFKKKTGDPFIMPSDVWDFINEAIPRCNVRYFCFDTWMFTEILERVWKKHGIKPEQHFVTKSDYDTWRSYQSPNAPHPMRLCYDKELKDEADQLIVKEGKRGHVVDHAWNQYKDQSDTVAGVCWFLTNFEVESTVVPYIGLQII
ncbi:MAG: hypothetical protein M0R80_09920 [Proteobacteria bacterium]|nr:hypothetical protein [Pseudomonadota bacterium]